MTPSEVRFAVCSCRQRFGNTSSKQSEYSYANAFDAAAFTIRDDRTIDVPAWVQPLVI
ncbi:MAG: hypothetical protein EHM67_00735, partial [Hyphomicrobiaceae bacterium]